MGTDGSIVNIALLRQDFESTDNYTLPYHTLVLYNVSDELNIYFCTNRKRHRDEKLTRF